MSDARDYEPPPGWRVESVGSGLDYSVVVLVPDGSRDVGPVTRSEIVLNAGHFIDTAEDRA